MSVIVTPGQIKDAADLLNSDFLRLSGDIAESQVAADFRSEWTDFHSTWIVFYTELSAWDALWGGTMDQIEDYRSRLVTWQARFREHGGVQSGPSIPDAPAPFNPIGDVKWIVGGIAVVALVFLAVKLKG